MAIQIFDQAMEKREPFTVFIGDKAYEGYASDIRIDRETVPDGWYVYDMRHDDDGEIIQIKDGYVMVNHLATFFTQNKLPMNRPDKSLYRNCEDEKDEFDYTFGLE